MVLCVMILLLRSKTLPEFYDVTTILANLLKFRRFSCNSACASPIMYACNQNFNNHRSLHYSHKDKENKMSEDEGKSKKLLAYWLFATVLIVFAAITAYIALFALPLGGSVMSVIKAGFPIWGITAVAAVIIYVGHHFYSQGKSG